MNQQALHIAMLLTFSLISCKPQIEIIENNPLLASVYTQTLYLSDIAPLIQTESTAEDSIQYTHAIIEKWVREAILMREAERNIPADLDIQKMVSDYRSSLILLNYKQKLVHANLDTTITENQQRKYYEEHKSQYKLDEPILSCIFLKVKKSASQMDKIEELWTNEKYPELIDVDEDAFEFRLMEEGSWNTWKDIKALLPKQFWSYDELKSKVARSKSSEEYKYFIKVMKFEDENKIPPLSYIKDQVQKVILHKRQSELLDQLEEDLYAKYANNNNVKINI